MAHIPLFINVKGKRVAVFGGGSVGERRARMFAEAGADVVVAAEEFSDGLRRMASKGLVKLVELKLPEGLGEAKRIIEWSWLVVVALGDQEAARLVAEEALRAGKLVNNAVDAGMGDVVVPFRATVWGDMQLAVTSLGRSGIAARTALEEAVRCLESREDLRRLYEALKAVKSELKARVPDAGERIKLYFEIAGDARFRELAVAGRLREALERALEIARASRRNP